MKFVEKEKVTVTPARSILLHPHDLALKLPDIFYRLIHTGYTPHGSMATVSLKVLREEVLKKFNIEADGENDFDEEIIEALKIAADLNPKQFEFALYRSPQDPNHTELGLKYYLTPKK